MRQTSTIIFLLRPISILPDKFQVVMWSTKRRSIKIHLKQKVKILMLVNFAKEQQQKNQTNKVLTFIN